MTIEFIEKHCVKCDYCIYENGRAAFCGEIDDGGCVSIPLKEVKRCIEGHDPIPHIAKFKACDRLDCGFGVMRILSVEGDRYVTQREGKMGRFGEPWPVKVLDTEEVDLMYELVDDEI